jgi:hypothetical protein
MKKFVGTVLAAGLTTLAVVATALATPPDREDATVGPSVVPAGVACPFAVRREPQNNSATLTTFSDGRVQLIATAQVTLTNLATGFSIVWQSHFVLTQTPGVDGGDDSVVVDGRFTSVSRTGEPTELGGVGPALLGVIGHARYTADPATGSTTTAAVDGAAVDLCAALSEGETP